MDEEKKEDSISILDIFKPSELTQTSQGYKTECPDCGLQGGRTEGFIIFPESNMAYCHSSGKHFRLLEAYALKKKIIRCLDGRETGESDSGNRTKVLAGELFTLTLEEFKNDFGTEKYNQLLNQLNIRKSIEIPGNDRLASDFADEIGDIYKSRNVLFHRGESNSVVRIGRYKKINENGEETTERGFQQVDGKEFITMIEMFIKPWTKIFTKNGSMVVSKSLTESQSNIVLHSQSFKDKLPTINRIFDIQIPIIYKKELTFPKKGYDKRFGSWLPHNAPQIKTDMYTLEESKNLINKIFEEFCFMSERDKTHAIAAFITPFLRGLFPKFSTRTPVFIYMANRERAGKDYCAGCSGMLYEGSNTEEPAISNDEKNQGSNEELRKKIMACMMEGKKRFHSANNKGLLNNSIFEGVTTAEKWSDRVLGKNTNIKFDNEMDYSLSGNIGMRLTPDLANRARIINLHLVDEDANSRTFKNPILHQWIYDNRVSIISALYKIIENWVLKGMPKGTIPFTSFPKWAEICGGVMEAAGYDNPCEKEKIIMVSLDSETEEMKLLFETCFEKNPNKWMSKNDIQKIVEIEGVMPYMDFTDRGHQTKFGMRIDRFINRKLSGILMKVDSLERRAAHRNFMFVKEQADDEKYIIDVIKNNITLPLIDDKKIEKTEIKSLIPLTPQLSTPPISLPKSSQSQLSQLSTQTTEVKLETLQDYTAYAKEFIKKEKEKENKPKEKTNRELQFWEAPECAGIVEQCTKEQTFEWVKNNPGVHYSKMHENLGLGCFKHVVTLFKENLIKKLNDGWSILIKEEKI
jgi:hypothetical protein